MSAEKLQRVADYLQHEADEGGVAAINSVWCLSHAPESPQASRKNDYPMTVRPGARTKPVEKREALSG
ncbi:MAG: hypothetical protein R3C53_24880 [Pirellulaceae bacterium]